MRPPTPSRRLLDLASEGPRSWSARRLWIRLPLRLRQEAVEAFLENPSVGEFHRGLQGALARAAGFRPETVQGMTPARAARLVARLPGRKLPQHEIVLREFLRTRRPELLGAYLDALGISHADGLMVEDHEPEVSPEEAAEAADGLLERFPADDVITYLVFLSLQTPNLTPGTPSWLEGKARDWAGAVDSPGVEEPVPAPAGADADHPEPELIREARAADGGEEPGPESPFTALDRLLIRAIVDGAQGVRGAQDLDTLEDMVEEVIHLNSDRHESFFHRGFLDILTGEAFRETLPAENVSRRGWYLAGWLSGRARRSEHAEVAKLLDDPVHGSALRSPARPWAPLVLPLLFNALCRTGREPEGAALLTPDFLLRHPTLLPRLLQEGTRLLRENDAERARPLFDRLGEVVAALESEGEPVTEPFFLEIRRRRAHCHRQLGEGDRARELLERLLEEEGDPSIHAMVQADLGLLDGGFRSLAEVRPWRSSAERNDLAAALERGRPRFEAALATESRFSSHGAWPLAVLAMIGGEWERARGLLSRALSSFLERPDRYAEERFLARVKVAAGVAEALAMDYTRLGRARELLVQGVEEGARIPRPLLGEVLAALEAHEDDLAGEVLTRVLELEGPDVLEALGEAEVARRTPAVARHLLAHAARTELPGEARAAALRQALPILLAQHPPEVEDARRALDELEGLAREGMGWEAFEALLSDPANVDPAWGPEDAAWARIHLLEARERFEEAVEVLRDLLAQVLSTNSWSPEEEAEAIVARARSYGLDPEWTRHLRERLAAWKREYGEDEAPSLPSTHPNQPLRILIVGGDERQRDLKERVEAYLQAGGEALRVEHLPTGWSGNWSKTLDDARSAVRRHDAVVLLRFMRTEFGRSLRADLECPWVHCPGVGTQQVARMVQKAAVWAAKERE